MGFSAEIVARAARRTLADVPSAAIDAAKAAILDTFAVALAARNERVVSIVEGFVRDEGGTGACAIWGSELRASPPRAALVNGTAAHALDFDDVCWAMNAHPSSVLWPAALVAAEMAGASGAQALLGYISGFEAEADLGAALGKEHYAAGFHPTATLGTLAAAVAAGRVLGADESILRRALGIACSEAAGSRMSFGTDAKPLHAGLAAQAGVTAALLAVRGMTAREDSIEGELGFAALYRGTVPTTVRAHYALVSPGVELKPYPSCRFTHRVIDAVLALSARNEERGLLGIECVVDPFARDIVVHSRPTTGLEAKFSMEYCAAVAWLDGVPGPSAFSDARAAEDDVQRLLRRVTVRPGSADAETVTVRWADGRADSETVRVAKGSPSMPLTRTERLEKAQACASFQLRERFAPFVEQVERLEAVADVRQLTALLRPSG
jgi:2-methylcitrate dehydratase PrpD